MGKLYQRTLDCSGLRQIDLSRIVDILTDDTIRTAIFLGENFVCSDGSSRE